MADPCVPTYGAISSSTPSEAEALTVPQSHQDDVSFDTKQTYYLKPNTRWTRRKVWATAVPILAACIVMGAIAYFLLRDFGHLYPGRGGDRSPFYSNGGMSSSSEEKSTTSSSSSKSVIPSDSTISHQSSVRSKHEQSVTDAEGGASCAVHPDCSKLIGSCCPTTDGHTLSCCNS